MMGLQRLMESPLNARYELHTCIQTKAAGGLNPRLMLSMAKEIRKWRPDVLHVRGLQNEGFHGLLAGKIAGCRRIVLSVHGFIGDLVAAPSRLRQRVVADFLEPFTLRHADAVYCVCYSAANREVIRHNTKRFFGVIHNAVPLPMLSSVDPSVRVSLGLSKEDKVAICVARMTREKGVFDLLDATATLVHRGLSNLKVVLVGDGPDMRSVQEMAKRLTPGHVICLGQRKDVLALLQASDFFVFPSLHENLANALLEAMSVGKAVVATNVGGNPEVVISNETGLLVPSRNPAALASAMLQLSQDDPLNRRMGLAGRKRIEEHFSIDLLIERLDQVYRRMLMI